MEEPLLSIKGRNGQLELLNDRVRICRRGLMALFLQGLKGNKEVFYSDITSVQFKMPGYTVGYLQFTFSGGLENKKGGFSAVTDENTVTFDHKQKKNFEFAKAEIDQRIAQAKKGASGQGAGLLELEKLASLKEKGIITDEEFTEQKQRILGNPIDSSQIVAFKAALEQEEKTKEKNRQRFWDVFGCLVGGLVIWSSFGLFGQYPVLALSYMILGLIPTPLFPWLTNRLAGYQASTGFRTILFIAGYIGFSVWLGHSR